MRFAIFRALRPPIALLGVTTTIGRCPDADGHVYIAALTGILGSPSLLGVTSEHTDRLVKEGREECGGQGTTSWVCALRPWAACCGRTA